MLLPLIRSKTAGPAWSGLRVVLSSRLRGRVESYSLPRRGRSTAARSRSRSLRSRSSARKTPFMLDTPYALGRSAGRRRGSCASERLDVPGPVRRRDGGDSIRRRSALRRLRSADFSFRRSSRRLFCAANAVVGCATARGTSSSSGVVSIGVMKSDSLSLAEPDEEEEDDEVAMPAPNLSTAARRCGGLQSASLPTRAGGNGRRGPVKARFGPGGGSGTRSDVSPP